MSESINSNTSASSQRSRSSGFTLPELLITVLMMGVIATVLAASITVTLRTRAGNEGRLNVAAAEYSIGLVVPSDLASAATVDTDPSLSPCPGGCPAGIDLDGSNAMMMTWVLTEDDGVSTYEITINVQYHFRLSDDGVTYELNRIECRSTPGSTSTSASWVCTQRTVLRDLPGPGPGKTFTPGVTAPIWVLQVSEPLAPDATSTTQINADTSTRKDANRVVITVNGGAVVNGRGGGSNQVSITAGGTTRTEIEPTSAFNAPSFAKARSRCGGPITLIVDDSGSIGSNIGDVENGVKAFVEAFAGTPTQIQVVRFDRTATVVGASGSAADWSKYYDMTVPGDVTALKNGANFSAGGATNWEDALFRTFYNKDATVQQKLPKTVVLFTDGDPTARRNNLGDPNTTSDDADYRGNQGALPANPVDLGTGWGVTNGSDFNQESFNRADYIADLFRSSVRFIGVGVGGITSNTAEWIDSPGAGYVAQYERGSHRYQQADYVYYGRRKSNNKWYYISKEKYDSQDNKYYQFARGTDWNWTSHSNYDANNVDGGESDGYRDGLGYSDYSWPYLDWEPTSTPGSGNGYRSTRTYPSSEPSGGYEGYETGSSSSVASKTVLARLIAGNDYGVEAIPDGTGSYTNASEADMYLLPNFDKLTEAFRAVALAECGGTVTLQTKVGGVSAPDPFTYQNTRIVESSGVDRDGFEQTTVTTNQTYATGTFDFNIPDGSFVDVEITPQNLSDVTNYQFVSWTCSAGSTTFSPTTVPQASGWPGITFQITPNTAYSCTMNVKTA